ncbi:hypothetical protein BWI17_07245 [Betaproteobacteria bacterium GR16-43]|nr:hypothetical protein BWI17_07245 [Betaproteobacteria bacterium GR16-43]
MLAALLASLALAAHAEDVNPRVIASFPEGPGPFPAVVFAPGQGYHARLPILEEGAAALVRSGVAVFRLDWRYFANDPKNGMPSPNLDAEVAEMTGVVKQARADKRVDASRIFLAGKSLGTRVGWRVFVADPSLKAIVLLTPTCHEGPIEKAYVGIATEARPVAMVLGDQDPVCPLPNLYRSVGALPATNRIVVLGGNHSFGYPATQGAEGVQAGARNVDIAARYLADFVRELTSTSALRDPGGK